MLTTLVALAAGVSGVYVRAEDLPAADVEPPTAFFDTSMTTRLPTGEPRCTPVRALQLRGIHAQDFGWLLVAATADRRDDDPGGRCLGTEDIDLLRRRLQKVLEDQGFITSLVVLDSDELETSGVLKLKLVPGLLRKVRTSADTPLPVSLRNALPARPGQVLQLHDIEQGLDNLRRVPGVEAEIDIVPVELDSPDAAQSDLLLQYRQSHFLRVHVAADNGGSAIGKYQASATLAWDNPLSLNDLLSLSVGGGRGQQQNRGIRSTSLNYSVPWGYWLFGGTASHVRFHQAVAGAGQSYEYGGVSNTSEVFAQRVVWRGASGKSSLGARVFRRDSSSFLDGGEIDGQRRVTSVWELNANHRQTFGPAVWDLTLALRQGTGAFGALRSAEETPGEGTSRLRMTLADVAYAQPMSVLGPAWRFSSNWHGQWNQTSLPFQDQIVLGPRHTVRGFDGRNSLLAERGWYWRNDLARTLMEGQEAYLAVDVGKVGGPSSALLVGRALAGSVMGVRGERGPLRYDVFWGGPLHRPGQFQTSRAIAGFYLAYGF